MAFEVYNRGSRSYLTQRLEDAEFFGIRVGFVRERLEAIGIDRETRRVAVLIDCDACRLAFRLPKRGECTSNVSPCGTRRVQIAIRGALRRLGFPEGELFASIPTTIDDGMIIVDLADYLPRPEAAAG